MHLPDAESSHITEIAQQLRALTKVLLADLPPDGPPVHFESTADLLGTQPADRLFQIVSGQLKASCDGKWVYSAEAGDLVGLAGAMQIPECTLQSDGPVELVSYQRDRLIRHAASCDALQLSWTRFLLYQTAFFSQCLAFKTAPQFKPATGFLDFEEGETIIHQNEEADCVYTLLEGSADALRDGVKVGEVHAEEIFGAMAVFTGQPRSASVVASSECSVLAVRKEEFLSLIVYQPKLCLSLVEEMAEKINQLNRQVLELQRG